jgi:hypothetical protein
MVIEILGPQEGISSVDPGDKPSIFELCQAVDGGQLNFEGMRRSSFVPVFSVCLLFLELLHRARFQWGVMPVIAVCGVG